MKTITNRGLLPLLVLGALLMPLQAEKVNEVTNPRRASGSWVFDGGKVLAPAYIGMIDAVCRELQARTGIELAVVTVGDLGGLEIGDFAEKLFRRFAIGATGKDNGLLLLLSRDDRRVRLEVGYGLEGNIPDIQASRLLEQEGLAHLRAGRFGRGLFIAARDIAGAAATAAGETMAIADPVSWPGETAPPAPPAAPVPLRGANRPPAPSTLGYAAGLLGLALLGLGWTQWRFNRARGRAARRRVISQAVAPTVLTWGAASGSFAFLFASAKAFFPSLAALLAPPALATAGQLLASRRLRRRLASYRLPCRACGKPMEMADQSQEQHLLTVEQAAEERAGGMDYEFWRCPACGADECLATKQGRAAKCPKCSRRTLVSERTTLKEATREEEGRTRLTQTCLNPKCGYSLTREQSTPRLASPGSPSSSSHSSPSSFGGGRSGGAGASKGF